jgi:hypothetical protein
MPPNMWNELLNYNKCTEEELRDFITSRTALSFRKLEVLKTTRKPFLVSHLRKLDRCITFRFLDLAPELRLEVYHHILVAKDDQSGRVQAIEPALLRTCKLVYKEAELMLYCDNKFEVSINVDNADEMHKNEAARKRGHKCRRSHYTDIPQPGSSRQYRYTQEHSECEKLSDCMVSGKCLFMLRRARHLTLRLGQCTSDMQEAIARLCLMLSGTSEMKNMTIITHKRLATLDASALAEILWPAAFLTYQINLEILGGSRSLQAALTKYRKTLRKDLRRTLEAPGDLIVKTLMRSERVIIQQDKAWWYRFNTGLMLNEVLRSIGEIRTSDGFRDFTKAWKCLQSYVNEDDGNLRFLERVSKKDTESFPR